MYLLGHLIIDKLFLGSINILIFYKNNLKIDIRATLIDIEAIEFVFLDFLGLFDFWCRF